ncbi:MAG TPA: hypothetical protein VG755_25555 [Nannocystaceae bacterium]|nr:hypothetical protein [Nannocystaceae bacterium]
MSARVVAMIPPLFVACLCACPSSSPDSGKSATVAKSDAKVETKVETKTEAKAPDEAPSGRVLDGPLPIAGLIGKPPAEVEAQLAEPLGKGMARESCVRFVPDRTWFQCKFALQRYGDKSGAYKAISVEYEDGKATALGFEGFVRAEGTIEPKTALAYVGLELPGEPKLEHPSADTNVWSFFNGAARLRIDGRQYRVIVSSVGADWARTKVEVKLNDPLSDDEKSRIVQTRQPDAPG